MISGRYEKNKIKLSSVLIICMLVLGSFFGICIFENDNGSVEAATLIVGPGQTYTTIQSAISAAIPGDTIYVYNGTYNENLVINKKVYLIGNGTDNSIVDGQGTGNVIHITVDGVEISGFTVKNSGTYNDGIKLTNVHACFINNTKLSSNGGSGIFIDRGSYNEIHNNNISSNDFYGVFIFHSCNNNISGNNIENNGYGWVNISDPAGIKFQNSNDSIISWNVITNNNQTGIRSLNSNNNMIKYNIIQDHYRGIFWDSTDSGNIIYLNDFLNNIEGTNATAGFRFWNSSKPLSYLYNNTNFTNYLGNYWDDYSGTDNEGEGIGDSPHSIASDYDYFPLIKPFENYILIPTSIKVEMDATNSNFTDKTVSLITQEATLNATVSGDFNGTYNATKLELVIINSSSFAGSGFFKAKWIATIEGKPYNGTWQGMLFQQPEDIKIYFKGTIFGGLQGITDGYLLESSTGSGTYDLYNSTWTIGYIGTDIVFAKLTLNGTVDYQTSKESTSLIYILQASLKGKSKGYYNGSLNVVLTHVCINNKTNQYHGEGFSYITYVCTYGSGTGWTYDKNVSKETVKLTGWFSDPLWGIIFGTLYDGEQLQSLSISMSRIDIGLPPRPIIKLAVWGRNRVSPGQTVNYFLEYRNSGLKPANNTDIIMKLPKNTTYKSHTGSGIYNNSTHQVIWRRNISAKSKNIVSVKCSVKWALTQGTKLLCNGSVQDFIRNVTLADDSYESIVTVARDPNIKYGPEGNVSQGQRLNYTIEYENEGSGIAFGVYFTDELSVNLNDSSMEIGPVISTSNSSIIAPPGFYDPGTRTIIWFVGEVGPAEGGYANISINVTDDAPHTSEILNYGTVYFPSVPEVTRTNGIVSMVLINQRPIAYAGNNLVVKTFEEVLFDGSGSYDSDGKIVNYTWDFGDSKTGYGKITTHSYMNDGIYTTNLSVKDDKDLISYHEIFVTVLNRLPEAKLEVDFAEVKTNENVTFDASKSSDLDGAVSDYYFDFGDGSNSGWVQTSAISHKYSYGTATYKAKLQIKDDDGAISSNIAELEITVNNREPIPKLLVIPIEDYTYQDIWCGASESTDLDGYIISYYFDFGDGNNSGWITTPWAIHQYTDGTTKYTISLEVKDNFGAVSSIVSTAEILINNIKPVAKLAVDHTFVDTLEEVTFDASESYDIDGTELEYYFNFGDGINSGWITDSVTKHIYTMGTKEYTIDLIVKDYDNETATTNYTITVSNRPPHADAGPDQSVYVHETVTFNASSSHDLDGEITEYKWNFGDGKDSDWITTAKTTHTYDYSGIYEVSLFVTDGESQTADICIITVSDIEISTPVISPNFPTIIELNEDFGEMVLELTVYELHSNIDYVYDDLKWYVTGNSGTIFQITGDNSTGTTADTFVFTSIINEYGTEELTYHLYDPDGVEVIINQTLIVHPVNDPPEIALMAEITVNVNEELILDLEKYIDDVDTAFSELIIETDDMEHSEITVGSLVIIYDTIGEYYIQIQVKDGELTLDHTITVSVIDPNDKDNDGLPDTWEEQFGLDPNDPEDAKADFDNDFLKNFKEHELGTDPTKYDTDGDGFNDRIDPYPIDPTRPTISTGDDKPIINIRLLTIIIILLVIILTIGILTSIIVKNRNKRIKKPFNDYELVRNIRDDIIEGKQTSETELSDAQLGSILSKSYQNDEISEDTYRLIEDENLIMDAEPNKKDLSRIK